MWFKIIGKAIVVLVGFGAPAFRFTSLHSCPLQYRFRWLHSASISVSIADCLYALKSLRWFKIIRKAIVVLVGFGAPAFRFTSLHSCSLQSGLGGYYSASIFVSIADCLYALKSLMWFKIIGKAIVVLVGFGAPAFRFTSLHSCSLQSGLGGCIVLLFSFR